MKVALLGSGSPSRSHQVVSWGFPPTERGKGRWNLATKMRGGG